MKRIEIDELKKISSDMLREVDKVCRKNNITYYLSFGSLIGAVGIRDSYLGTMI